LNSATLKSDLTAYSRFDFRDRMAGIRCPALLIRGQDDFVVDAAMVKETAARLTNARVVEVVMPEGVGHYSHVEQPVEHGRLVLDFLERHGIAG
jgi:pimeloyl-ACP methyl ester carboxylesterase